MTNDRILTAVAALLLAGCSTRVPPAAIAWNDATSSLSPAASEESGRATKGDGYLRVETDRDQRQIGANYYYNLRRPYDLYAADGALVRSTVDNQGWRSGEEPITLALPAGRYVVASMFGTVYRKVQVEIRPGETTEVPADALRDAPSVFAH